MSFMAVGFTKSFRFLTLLVLGTTANIGLAQRIYWQPQQSTGRITCLYGEVKVLATGPMTYYCGCQWQPDKPASGYTGIQQVDPFHKTVIFSEWDTSGTEPSQLVKLAPGASNGRFKALESTTGLKTGIHTHLAYAWPNEKNFRFFVKRTLASGHRVVTSDYYYDELEKKWELEGRTVNPAGSLESTKSLGKELSSFINSWNAYERRRPKLALFRLWVGSAPNELHPVTHASGDGKWGTFSNSFFIAYGPPATYPALVKTLMDSSDRVEGADGKVLGIKRLSIHKKLATELSLLN